MTEHNYNWKRFFCPREGRLDLLSDGGYLVDPEADWAKYLSQDLKEFSAIIDAPCLILLGERGIGKSRFLKAQKNSIDQRVKERGGTLLWLNLNSFSSDSTLIDELFKSREFIDWTTGSHELHLWLDSFDECQLHIKTLEGLLIRKLEPHTEKIERLFLRIACRTAGWPKSLEQELNQLWKDKALRVYELAPLRRIDVREAATKNNLVPEEFFVEVRRTQTTPFAIKPVTLDFLIDLYKQNQHLPQTQSELYLQGCQLLCKESRNLELMRKLTFQKRMAIASRIAALTLFTNRSAIWTETEQGNMPDGDITIEQMCGGQDSADMNGLPKEFEVERPEIEETLATGLFSARGVGRIGWAHQSYADYLAAKYLKDRKLELPQMMSLITHPDDPEKHLVPQLYEAAAWLGTMDSGVFQEIMRTDPDVLLLSDVASVDEANRAALVEELLKLINEGKINTWSYRQYSKLKHSNIEQQLRLYLRDKSKTTDAHKVAIEIAESCNVRLLQQYLVDIALETTESIEVRENAARAVSSIGDEHTKKLLKPLATGDAGEDPRDQLKGYGLKAIWPEGISAQELFTLLTPPKQNNYFGAYNKFIYDDLVDGLQPKDLPIALNWIENEPECVHDALHLFSDLADAILTLAWKHLLAVHDVLTGFAKVALKRLKSDGYIIQKNGDSSFYTELYNDETKRLTLVKELVSLVSRSERDNDANYSSLVHSSDIPWMIECLQASNDNKEEKVWTRLLKRAWLDESDNPKYCDAIINASEINQTLRDFFTLPAVVFDSAQAQQMIDEYQLFEAYEEQDRQRKARLHIGRNPSQKVEECLNAFESGDMDAWWHLNWFLTFSLESKSCSEIEPDLTTYPGWIASTTATQRRIINAAQRYILEGEPQISEWLGKNKIHRPAYAGYRALQLLIKENFTSIEAIPAEVWEKWASIILKYPTAENSDAEKFQKELFKKAYQYAPNNILSTLKILIDEEIQEGHGYIFIINRVKFCWDKQIAQLLLTKAQEDNLKISHLKCLLEVLLEQNDLDAISFGESLVQFKQQKAGHRKRRRGSFQKAVIASRLLISHSSKMHWETIWSAIRQDIYLGRKIAEAVASYCDMNGFASNSLCFQEEQSADLYIWLGHQYPYLQDPQRDNGVYTPGVRDYITQLKYSLLNQLKERGTVQAIEQMQRIMLEFTDLDWLKLTLKETKYKTYQNIWRAPEPQDVLKLTQGQHKRLVQNGEQLLEVLIESLKRLEQELQGETPQAIDLWNEIDKNIFRPKDENRFSDYVKRHLEKDLKSAQILVNREVEFRRGTGGQPGERLDIKVDVFIPDNNGEKIKITAIIEVKGCWNTGLNSAMRDQLAGRYLEESQCYHGLYLVGWYFCPQWDENHQPNKNALRLTTEFRDIDSAQSHFDEQAAALSSDGKQVRAFVINTALR